MTDSPFKPYLFERSFDEGEEKKAKKEAELKAANDAKNAEAEPEEPEEPPPPPPVYTEEEMAQLKAEAFEEGRKAGHEEGRQDALDGIEAEIAKTAETVAQETAKLSEAQRRANDRAQANLVRIVKALLGKLMPIYLKRHGAEEALSVVADCIADLQDAGRLTIRLSEETANQLEERLQETARRAGFEGQIRILTDPAMGPSDVRVDWGAGGAERSYESIRDQVESAIDRAVAAAEADSGVLSQPRDETDEDAAEENETAATDAPPPDPPQED